MKPWEETWESGKRGHEQRVMKTDGAGDPLRERHIATVYTPTRGDEEGVSTWADAATKAEANAKLLAAAPEMARALLAHGHVRTNGRRAVEWHNHRCVDVDGECDEWCKSDREALRKAGVIP